MNATSLGGDFAELQQLLAVSYIARAYTQKAMTTAELEKLSAVLLGNLVQKEI